MADVLDIHNIEKFEVDDVGDVNVKTLKTKVTHRRGRGFKKDEKSEPCTPLSERSVAVVGNSSEPQRSVEGWIVFVTGIHEEAQEEDLHGVFAEYGKIKNLHLNLDRRTGYTKGYALIEYSLFKEAEEAITKLNQTKILDEVISVDWTFVKEYNRNRKSSGASSSRTPSIEPTIPRREESKWERRESRDRGNNSFKLEYVSN